MTDPAERVAQYRCGEVVRVTVEGRSAVGYIRAVHARFWNTPELCRFRYDVRFKKPLWSNYVLSVGEESITLLADDVRADTGESVPHSDTQQEDGDG